MSILFTNIPPGLAQDAGQFGTLKVDLGKETYEYKEEYRNAFNQSPKAGEFKKEGSGKIKKLEKNIIVLERCTIRVQVNTKKSMSSSKMEQTEITRDFGEFKFRLDEFTEYGVTKRCLVNVSGRHERQEWWEVIISN